MPRPGNFSNSVGRCCMIPDNPKGISKLRFWGKNRRINGISELPAFMQQRVSTFKTRRSLALENLALRQQLAVLQRSVKRPRLSNLDRGLCVLLRRFWTDWAKVLVIVKPDTVVRWHRAGFRRYWAWRSRRLRPGRPCVAPEVRELIRNMCRANPLWGAPRVHGELAKLGISISQAAVSKYMIRRRKPPSQTWRSFSTIMSRTWCPSTSSLLPTATFRILFVFIILRHDRRRIVHFNVTAHPSAEWTAQQIVEAFSWDTAPRHVLRDRDETTGRTSNGALRDSTSSWVRRRRALRGRAPTSNGSLEAFGASVSIT